MVPKTTVAPLQTKINNRYVISTADPKVGTANYTSYQNHLIELFKYNTNIAHINTSEVWSDISTNIIVIVKLTHKFNPLCFSGCFYESCAGQSLHKWYSGKNNQTL